MTLYDIMNKKPEELKINEVPAVAPVEEPVSVAVKENETPQVVTQGPKPTYKHTSWWQTPNYVEEQQKLENVAKKRMEADEKRARWQRNAAIIGDVAKLGLQSAALAGGSTKIDRFAPETTSANEKMQAIRDRNAAQIMEFAKQRAEAREAERADKNARGKLEASLAASEAEREYKAHKDASDLAYKLYSDQVEAAQKDRDYNLRVRIAESNAKLKKEYQDALSTSRSAKQKEAWVNKALGKANVFTSPDGLSVTIYDYSWKPNMQQVYDAIIADGVSDSSQRLAELSGKMTASRKEDFVKQNWHKSPRAVAYMQMLAQTNPESLKAGMVDEEEIIDYVPGGVEEEIIDYVPKK